MFHAALGEDGGRLGGGSRVHDLDARQELRLGFVRRDPVDHRIEHARQFRRRGRVEDHGHAGVMRDLRRPRDRFQRRFKLHEERGRALDFFLERRNVLRRERSVCAERNGDDVLSFGVHEDERGAGGFLPVDDEMRGDGILLHAHRGVASEEIVANFGDERAGTAFCGEPRHGDGLVRALAAGVHHEPSAGDRFARHGDLLPRDDHVGVRAAQNDYLFHVPYYSMRRAFVADAFAW